MSDDLALELLNSVAASMPASLEEALSQLQDFAETVRSRLKADRAKIYFVSRSPQGPRVWRIKTGGAGSSKQVPYEHNRGLVDFVIRRNTQLLVPSISKDPAFRVEEGIKQQGFDESGAPVEVVARYEGEMDGKSPGLPADDNESTVLYIPVRAEGRVRAVFSVARDWSSDGTPAAAFNWADAEKLKVALAPLAVACERYHHFEKAGGQKARTEELSKALREAVSLSQAFEAVASRTGVLAGSGASVLLDYRGDAARGWLYQNAEWADDVTGFGKSHQLFAAVCGGNSADWGRKLRPWVDDCFPDYVVRKILATTPTDQGQCRVIVLLDRRLAFPEPAYFADRLQEEYVEAFFRSACTSLDAFAAGLASRLTEAAERSEASVRASALGGHSPSPVRALELAAEQLRQATGAGAVLVYGARPGDGVLASVPPKEGVQWPAIAIGSRTHSILESADREGYWAVDSSSKTSGLDSNLLESLSKCLSWPEGVGSWQLVPALHDGQRVGYLKLLSRRSGPLLGRDHYELARRVAAQAAWEVRRERRRLALEHLGKRLNRIGSEQGRSLGQHLVNQLRDWARELLGRPTCQVLVVAVSSRSGTLVEDSTREPKPEAGPLTTDVFRRSTSWHTADNALHPALRGLGVAGIFEPLSIPGDSRLAGLVALGDGEAFDLTDQEILREAARFLAVLLQAERERSDTRLDMGLFRHAALGAIQGLTSNALALAEEAEAAGVSSGVLEPLRRRIRYEAEQLRLWRENQRFYLADRPDLEFRRALGPILKRSFERYRDAAELMQLKYSIRFPRREVYAVVDEPALDVAISNLMDNAVKYAFKAREVTVGLDETRDGRAVIWVEDIGHGISEEQRVRLYRMGSRQVGWDPFRSITGQGLGLMLVQKIIEAHDGTVKCESVQEDNSARAETIPYRVRFSLSLPTHRSLST